MKTKITLRPIFVLLGLFYFSFCGLAQEASEQLSDAEKMAQAQEDLFWRNVFFLGAVALGVLLVVLGRWYSAKR